MLEVVKRGRGRPKKVHTELKVKKPRGRPKGARNKIKQDELTSKVILEGDTLILAPNVNSNVSTTDTDTDTEIQRANGKLGNDGDIGTNGVEVGEVDISHSSTAHNFSKNSFANDSHIATNANSKSQKNLQKNSENVGSVSKPIVTKISPELVAAARRHLAATSLADYACMIDIPDTPMSSDEDVDVFSVIKLDSLAAHHLLICNELQKLVDPNNNEFDNIMFLMPPGSAKSTYIDVVFVAWYMSKFPRHQVILTSFGDSAAVNQARKTKALVNSKEHKALFPGVVPSKDRTAVDEWALSNGSSFLARGLGGEITGRRADLGIIDDPVKGAEDAESEASRNKTYDAYLRNFSSRLKPGAPKVLIMTRWHEDDLAGRILPDGWDGESGDIVSKADNTKWRVICLPAIANREDDPLNRSIGESLWPEWFGRKTGNPLDHWAPFRFDHKNWSSLYQQRPTPEDGVYFLRSNFKRYDLKDLPSDCKFYGTSDYAVLENKGDYTRLRIWAIDTKVEPAQVYLVAGWGGKTKSDRWIKEQVNLIREYRPLVWYGEKGAIQLAIEPMLREAMRNAQLMCNFVWMPSTTAKTVRARAAQLLCMEGRVHIPNNIDGDNFIEECIKFPDGKHDDDVDNFSLIGRALETITIPTYKPITAYVPKTTTAFNRRR